MFAKVQGTFKVTRMADLSKSAKEIHSTFWQDASRALQDAGFDVWFEELTLNQSDVMEAMRKES